MARKRIRPVTRFEVFKRDGFCCQYCGQKPPAVVLEVDHIIAVVSGGGNELDNLVTACKDCNRGKAARSLEVAPASISERAALLTEKREQMKAYERLLRQQRRKRDAFIKRMTDVFGEKYGPDTSISEASRQSIYRFMEKLPAEEIVEAARIANAKTKNNPPDTFRYFCGVCWSKIKERN